MTDRPDSEEARPVAAADLLDMRFLSEPAISPDGQRVAFVVARADADSNDYKAHIWMARADGTGRSRQFTHGAKRDGHPAWSPDGRWLAFTSSRSGHKEIWLIPTDGGEARRLTYTPHGAGNPSWAPDSRALAFTTEVGAEDPAPHHHSFESEDEQKKRKEKEAKAKRESPLRHIRLQYKRDGEGLWQGRYTHIWVQALDEDGASDGPPRQLTDGDYDDSPAVWSPDGQYLAFSSNRTMPDPDQVLVSDLFVVPAAGGTPQQLTSGKGPAHSPAWRPDGNALAYVGHDRAGEMGYGSNNILYVVPFVPGESAAHQRQDLSGHLDRPVDDTSLSDSRLGGLVNYPVWTPDGSAIYMTVSSWGRTELRRFPAVEGREVTVVAGGDRAITSFCFSADQTTLAFVVGSPANPGDLFTARVDAAGVTSGEQQITHVNKAPFAHAPRGLVEEIRFDGPDGTPLQGWIVKPPGFDPGQRYPAVLNIHGGPHLMYGFTYFHEFQALAAQGYVVFYMNPRGSQGYGQAFADVIRGCWGEPAMDDLMHGIDVLLEQGYVDPTRLAVSGGSYGGYMACWIIGHTQRFKVAVSSRPVTNLISFYGSSDAGWELTEWEFASLLPDPQAYEELWKHSPLSYAPQVETPLLLTHGEQDLRCPIEQSEEMFVALKR
ncbi:MAG TPA: S9 family peptidase, partial [Chloroflexia bacterium]|nr:S9 family peptidase [Chloroflexia bacterium]